MRTHKVIGFAITLFLLLPAGAEATPSPAEIKTLLEDMVNHPGCVTSGLFKSFPVTLADGIFGPGPSTNNAASYNLFVSIGLLSKSGKTYNLTSDGQKDYVPTRNGFCYSSGSEVSEVNDVAELRNDKIGYGVEKGWIATVLRLIGMSH